MIARSRRRKSYVEYISEINSSAGNENALCYYKSHQNQFQEIRPHIQLYLMADGESYQDCYCDLNAKVQAVISQIKVQVLLHVIT